MRTLRKIRIGVLVAAIAIAAIYLAAELLWYVGVDFVRLHEWGISAGPEVKSWSLLVLIGFCCILGSVERVVRTFHKTERRHDP